MNIAQHFGQHDPHQTTSVLLQKTLPSVKWLYFPQVPVVTLPWQPKLYWDPPRPRKRRCKILRANLKANLSLLFPLAWRKKEDKYWMFMKVQNWKTRFRPRKKSAASFPIITKRSWITAFLIVTLLNGGLNNLVQQALRMMPSVSTTGLLQTCEKYRIV